MTLILDAIEPIAYSLLGLSGLYAANGIVKLTDMGVRAVSCVVDTIREKHINSQQELLSLNVEIRKEKPPTTWRKVVNGWDSFYQTADSVGKSILCLSISVPLVVIAKHIQKSQY